MSHLIHWLATALLISTLATRSSSSEICGVTVTPHVVADSMMYRRPRDPDLAAKVRREIQMLSPYYLAGDAFQFERTRDKQGKLDWDCASIVSE